MANVPRENGDEIELEPDAWQRFDRAVDTVAKAPPQHREKTKAEEDAKTRLAP
jgi:hypothetical protein